LRPVIAELDEESYLDSQNKNFGKHDLQSNSLARTYTRFKSQILRERRMVKDDEEDSFKSEKIPLSEFNDTSPPYRSNFQI